MHRKYAGWVLILFLFVSVGSLEDTAFGQGMNSGLVAPGAALTRMASDFQPAGTEGPATEGPTADRDGNVYFTATFDAKIYRWSWETGAVSLYRENTGMANGMIFDAHGRLVMCEMANNRITRDDMKGNITVLADTFDGKKLYNPNDLWIDPGGGIYFSHQYFPIAEIIMPQVASGRGPEDAGALPPEAEKEGGMPFSMPDDIDTEALGILYISPDGQRVTRVTTDNPSPNGLIGTPDGKTLYVGATGVVHSYRINADGTLADKKLFCEITSDGMAMDERLNVYMTSDKNIYVYSPAGKLIEKIAMPVACSNVTFGGRDRKTLIVTSRGYTYTLDMAVRGAVTPGCS